MLVPGAAEPEPEPEPDPEFESFVDKPEVYTPPPLMRVDFREMLGDDSGRWSIQYKLTEQLGRPYLATQLAAALDPEVAARLITRIDELLGPEIERRMGEYVAQLQNDIDQVTASTLVRLAESADEKRRELTRERFATPSRFA